MGFSMSYSPLNSLEPNTSIQKELFVEGCIILVDKPMGWTSFDVVNKIRAKIRYGYDIKNIKVGHTGTLDPLATGLIMICTGRYTKKIDEFQKKAKKYEGTIFLGATTPTYDKESEPDQFFKVDHISDDDIEKARIQFSGELSQVPPMYSAIKVGGQTAYKVARKGKTIELKPRQVHIHQLELTRIDQHTLAFSVHCSKGTYIRSLAYDIGKWLNSGAYLLSLRRTAIGEWSIDDAFTVEDIVSLIEIGSK